MKHIYFDGSAGMSGDMILGALLDLGVPQSRFIQKMGELCLPVEIHIKEVKRASLRGLKVDVHTHENHTHSRKWKDIDAFIKKSSFSSTVKEHSLAVFKRLFEAESRVHGHNFREAHLHEAGANDALVDVMGSCYLLETLDVSEIYASPLNVGEGWVKAAHGTLPVPPPAVAELLKGIPVYSAWVKNELVTPTGAAIISTLARNFISFPEITYEKIGYGAGTRDFPGFPNILRVFYGEAREFNPGKKVYLIEATIDDSTPQVLAGYLDTALGLGALDVFLTPVVMKKNRLATKLTVLAEIDKIDILIASIFQETSSIGVRYFPVTRRILKRATEKVKILDEEVRIKVSYLEGKVVNVQPEYSDCLKTARKKRVPVKHVIQLAVKESAKKVE